MLAVWMLAATALPAAASAASTTHPVQLSVRDRELLSAMLCAPIGAAGIEHLQAFTLRTAAREIRVDVRCEPHATSYSVPVARQASCGGSRGSWQCEPGRDVLRLTLPDQSLLTVVPEQVPLQLAAEVTRQAAGQTIRPFYRPAVKVMRGQCTVGRAGTSSRQGLESFSIECGPTRITLTKDCWDGGCRYFIPFAENY